MAYYDGTLSQNRVLFSAVTGALYNMIIRQTVRSDPESEGQLSLLDDFKRDAGLYGDRILEYFCSSLIVKDYKPDTEEQLNVLATARPKPPYCEKVEIDTVKYAELTLDDFLTKQGFSDESTFSAFKDVMTQKLNSVKKTYLEKLFNVYMGTEKSELNEQLITINLPTAEEVADAESRARISAQTIAREVSDIMVSLTEDSTSRFTDIGSNDTEYLHCWRKEDMICIFNTKALNKITYMDLPTMFHDTEVMSAIKKNIRRLPPEYWGDVNGSSVTASNGTTIRSLTDQTVIDSSGIKHHVRPGQIIPKNVTLVTGGNITVPSYTQNDKYLCKFVHKDSVPVLDAFNSNSEFWNAKNLSRNLYTHFMYNTFVRFTGLPFVTIKAE